MRIEICAPVTLSGQILCILVKFSDWTLSYINSNISFMQLLTMFQGKHFIWTRLHTDITSNASQLNTIMCTTK